MLCGLLSAFGAIWRRAKFRSEFMDVHGPVAFRAVLVECKGL